MESNARAAMERIGELEGTLTDLRLQLESVTSKLARDSRNTSLVIQRVNIMKRIMLAQSELDTLRPTPGAR